MPETKESIEKILNDTDQETMAKVQNQLRAIADILNKAKIPATIKPENMQIPEEARASIDADKLKELTEGDRLYLTLPERLSFLAAKCSHYVEVASRRKISDFEPLSRFMDSVQKGGKNIYFILQSDGTCYLTDKRSGTPSKIWATVDEMAVDMALKEKGR